jgi:beta-galactosidase/beta-glucuronidase
VRHTATRLLSAALFLCLTSPTLRAAETAWKPAAAPLMTRWAKDVSPDKARPEYPRPNMVRKEWKSLNGLWEFAFDDENRGAEAGWKSGYAFPERILVPWTYESALSGIGKGKEVHERVWYRRMFDVPRGWKGKRTLLHFGAVDWRSQVWVNGKDMGVHVGGYAPFSCDITAALKPDGPQEVVVAVYDPADPKKGAFQPKGKQLGSHSIWYTRTTGIWQSVWLEPVNATYLASVNLKTKSGGGEATITVSADVPRADDTSLDMAIVRNGKRIPVKRGAVGAFAGGPSSVLTEEVSISNSDVELWSPEKPVLYDVTLTLKQNGRTVDEVKTYCAFRTVGMANGRITLNGKPYFLRGVLDQGFWPDGIYTPPTDEAIKQEVVTTKAFGFNLARKHVKVEDPRWYYWCDKLGLLVAQDMPSSHNLGTEEAKKNFVHEWSEVMKTVRSYPCVIIWVPFNEDWGHPEAFQDEVVKITRRADPSRPIIDASGWTQRGLTDITDIHDYGNDLKKHARTDYPRPTLIGEYGGVALPVEGHTWITGWGYQTVKTPEELLAKYRFLTDQINGAAGLSGFVYTQLTDVEQELNGVMTYDRLPKAPPEKFGAINRGR